MQRIEHRTPWAWAIATFFGVGNLRPGPGTYGSAAAALLWFYLLHLHPLAPIPRFAVTLAAALVVTLIGIPAATRVAREAGRKDPGFVVIDEVAGQLVVLAAARSSFFGMLLAFVLFRLFDITKPWPVRRFEKLPEGTGIVVDDLAAGVYGFIAYCLLLHPYMKLLAHFGAA